MVVVRPGGGSNEHIKSWHGTHERATLARACATQVSRNGREVRTEVSRINRLRRHKSDTLARADFRIDCDPMPHRCN